MKHGSLFSGIGGFDLAAQWMGWENIFHCEWMEFPRKVLDYYWPDADSHVDICKTDFTKYANTIDILTGGFPCQPFSLAGKRKGTDDERYLWHEMLRAIREIKPKWVIAENVFGIVNIDSGMVFEQVCLDLENEGYEVQPFIIPAAAKNAPHRRDRCWFIAQNTMHSGCLHRGNEQKRAKIREQRNTCTGNNERICISKRNATNPESLRINRKEKYENNHRQSGEQRGYNFDNISKIQRRYITTNPSSRRISRHGRESQRESLQATEFNENDCKFNRPMDWRKFPTQSPICSRNDGLSTKLDGITFPKWRNESIKGYGNAIVPQIAYQLFQIIEHESKNKNTKDKQP